MYFRSFTSRTRRARRAEPVLGDLEKPCYTPRDTPHLGGLHIRRDIGRRWHVCVEEMVNEDQDGGVGDT